MPPTPAAAPRIRQRTPLTIAAGTFFEANDITNLLQIIGERAR
jgi:hypothetical protein